MASRKVYDSLFFFRINYPSIAQIILSLLLPLIAIKHYFEFHIITDNTELVIRLIPIFLEMVIVPIYIGSLDWLFLKISYNEKFILSECLFMGLKRWPELFAFSVIFKLIFFNGILYFGVLIFILPGLFLFARFGFAQFLIMYKNAGPVTAFKRSFVLSKGYTWEIISTITITAIVLMIFEWFLNKLITSNFTGAIIKSTFMALLWTLPVIMLFRFYCLTGDMPLTDKGSDPSGQHKT